MIELKSRQEERTTDERKKRAGSQNRIPNWASFLPDVTLHFWMSLVIKHGFFHSSFCCSLRTAKDSHWLPVDFVRLTVFFTLYVVSNGRFRTLCQSNCISVFFATSVQRSHRISDVVLSIRLTFNRVNFVSCGTQRERSAHTSIDSLTGIDVENSWQHNLQVVHRRSWSRISSRLSSQKCFQGSSRNSLPEASRWPPMIWSTHILMLRTVLRPVVMVLKVCEVSLSRKTTLACWLLKAVLAQSSDLWSFRSAPGIGRESVVSFRLLWLGRCPNRNKSLHLVKGFWLSRYNLWCPLRTGESPQALLLGYSFVCFSFLLRKPSKIWCETSTIKNSERCVGNVKTNWNRGLLWRNSVSVQKKKSFSNRGRKLRLSVIIAYIAGSCKSAKWQDSFELGRAVSIRTDFGIPQVENCI